MQNYKSQKFSFLVFAFILIFGSILYFYFDYLARKRSRYYFLITRKIQSFVYIAFYILLFHYG